jgi:guanylate kinase
VVSGPSGAGKSSLCGEVLARVPWLRAAVSHTTRPPRPGEQEGKDYFFVDGETFDRMIRDDAFLEWADVHEHRYGSSRENLRSGEKTQSLLFEVDWKGASRIRLEMEEAVLVFVMTPSLDDLIHRIKERGPISPEELSVRIRTATMEIQKAADFDYLVINDNFDEALNELQSIITVESCKRRHSIPAWTERWEKEIQAQEKGKGKESC